MKQCNTCKQSKHPSEFDKDATRKDGLRSNCKACRSLQGKAYYAVNAEAVRIKSAAYHVANREAIRIKKATYYAANRETVLAPDGEDYAARREDHWRRRGVDHTFSFRQFNTMLDMQGHVCKLCFRADTRNGKPCSLAADHDHETCFVRGLLCLGCNRRLSQVERHGLNGPHHCGIAFASRAFLYLAAAADKQQHLASRAA